MDVSSGRLRNYLADQLEECTEADVEERLEYLAGLVAQLDGDIESDVRVFAALANETRYEILRVLDRADEELCVCEINVVIDASEATISQALSQLVDVDLVTRRKDGRWRTYRTTTRATAFLATFDGLKRTGG
ncbi:MAG: metalloregulator ArsR/SmtB family transcription factor [Halapricum sp.]